MNKVIDNSTRRTAFRGWLNRHLKIERWKFSDDVLRQGLHSLGINDGDIYAETNASVIRLYASELVLKRSRCGIADTDQYCRAVEHLLDYAEFLDWLRLTDSDEAELLDIPGHMKCEMLRRIRRRITEANGIPYDKTECDNLGPCWGTCPKCDAEIAFLDEQLHGMKARGEKIVIEGLGEDELGQYSEYLDSDSGKDEELVDGEFDPVTVMGEMGENPRRGVLDCTIDELEVSVRTYQILRRAGIYNVEELIELSEEDLQKIPHMSSKGIEEIRERLSELGLSLRPCTDDDLTDD